MKEYVKILISDSQVIMRNMLLSIIENEGYKVALAPNLTVTLQEMRSNKYDILIIDMKLFKDEIKNQFKKIIEEFDDCSVIAMTGYGDSDSVSKALEGGANEYISKPFKSAELSLIIERAYWRLVSQRSAKEKSPKVIH